MKKTWNQWSKIRSALRKVWLYSPQRREALIAAKMEKDPFYICYLCKKIYPKYAIDVDHVEPCGSLLNYLDLETFARRLFAGELQVVCKPCHALKTKEKK